MPLSRLHVPLSAEISAAMEVAKTSDEASKYVVQRVTAILTATKMLKKSGDLIKKLEDFAQYVDFKSRVSPQIWSGHVGKSTDFKNMQEHIAEDAVKAVKAHTQGDIKLDMAISVAGEILRGYSAGGQQIKDPVILEMLDKLFNAWLAENNIVSKASALYEANAKGEITHDANGEVKVNSEHIKQLMNDPEKGLVKYAQEKDFALTIDTNHAYPAEQVVKKPTPSDTSGESVEVEPEGPAI